MKLLNYKLHVLVLFVLISLISLGCKKFLDTELSTSEIVSDKVFNDDLNATSAVAGLYRNMLDGSFAGGGADGISALTGLSSDELHNLLEDPQYTPFENNAILADDPKVLAFWTRAYESVYQANDILESLQNSTGISVSAKRQLMGEALFVRAFHYFYLVNFFGKVPVVITTDYRENAKVTRLETDQVYNQIKADLLEAQSLLSESYTGTERARPNKSTATALLARVYLYLNDWGNAEIQADNVISNSAFKIEPNLSNVFLKASGEVIWQLASIAPLNTNEAANFVILYGAGSSTALMSDRLLSSFEANDLRKENWIGVYNDGSGDLYFPYKYKSADYDLPITEHFVVLRLAEQYLIRAEARAEQGKLSEAINDLDVIRKRAGLPLIKDTNPGITQNVLLLAIEKERQVELFTEWGHRWFDLKRTNRATAVLQPLKTDWSVNDGLYPIPQAEFNKNPKLGDQNDGY